MDEGRKRTILIAASILVARKWAQLDGRPSPTLEAAISDAISLAERILTGIDSRTRKAMVTAVQMDSSIRTRSCGFDFFLPIIPRQHGIPLVV